MIYFGQQRTQSCQLLACLQRRPAILRAVAVAVLALGLEAVRISTNRPILYLKSPGTVSVDQNVIFTEEPEG